ncbi:uncharacterized protein METZ01_LOCUS224719, partial [marine metagenome]
FQHHWPQPVLCWPQTPKAQTPPSSSPRCHLYHTVIFGG